MSRIGKQPISLPKGVALTFSKESHTVTVKGPKWELSKEITGAITLEQEDGKITESRPSEAKNHKALHGLYRALINNMVVGTSEGFTKKLELAHHGVIFAFSAVITWRNTIQIVLDPGIDRVGPYDRSTCFADRLDRSTRLLASPSTRLDSSNQRSTWSIDLTFHQFIESLNGFIQWMVWTCVKRWRYE